MKCPSCQSENEEVATHCATCGANIVTGKYDAADDPTNAPPVPEVAPVTEATPEVPKEVPVVRRKPFFA